MLLLLRAAPEGERVQEGERVNGEKAMPEKLPTHVGNRAIGRGGEVGLFPPGPKPKGRGGRAKDASTSFHRKEKRLKP